MDVMRTWTRRQWTIAAWTYLAALLAMGAIGETLPIASEGRAVPVHWWNWVTLALSPPLIALIVASFVPAAARDRSQARDKTTTGLGAVIGTVAMACPVCNPIAIPLFGSAGVLSFLEPDRGLIALLSIVLLAVTLALRLRTGRSCAITPARQPSG